MYIFLDYNTDLSHDYLEHLFFMFYKDASTYYKFKYDNKCKKLMWLY